MEDIDDMTKPELIDFINKMSVDYDGLIEGYRDAAKEWQELYEKARKDGDDTFHEMKKLLEKSIESTKEAYTIAESKNETLTNYTKINLN